MTFTCSPLLGCWARCTLTYRYLRFDRIWLAGWRLNAIRVRCGWMYTSIRLIRIAHKHYVLSGIFACRIFVPRFGTVNWQRNSLNGKIDHMEPYEANRGARVRNVYWWFASSPIRAVSVSCIRIILTYIYVVGNVGMSMPLRRGSNKWAST